jgi:hypothetical protein
MIERARGEAVGDLDEAEVLAHPDDEFLGEATHVHHAQAGSRREFDGEVTVAHGVQAVLAHAVHAEGFRHALAVQRVGGAGESGADPSGSTLVRRRTSCMRSASRVEHLHVGQQVVGKAHGLGHLQVGEAGQDDVHVLLRHLHQRLLQVGQQAADQINLATQPQAHVGGHLVVAAAAGVQALASVTHELRQAGFNIQVHVFEIELPLELGRTRSPG